MSFIPLTKPLSELIKQNPFIGKYKTEDLKDCDEVELTNATVDISQRLKIKLKSGRCSSVFIQQMARHHLQCYERFGCEIHQYHLPTILDTIECIEGGQKMNIRPFNGELLSGLQHIHHNSITFRVKNIERYWIEKCRIRFNNKKKIKAKDEIEFQNELLNEIFKQLLIEHPQEIAQEKALIVLLSKIHNETIFRKSEEQTGEWIVFAEKNDIIYYLCLATHNEVKPDNDQVILNRIKPCLTEFPELKNNFGGQI